MLFLFKGIVWFQLKSSLFCCYPGIILALQCDAISHKNYSSLKNLSYCLIGTTSTTRTGQPRSPTTPSWPWTVLAKSSTLGAKTFSSCLTWSPSTHKTTFGWLTSPCIKSSSSGHTEERPKSLLSLWDRGWVFSPSSFLLFYGPPVKEGLQQRD